MTEIVINPPASNQIVISPGNPAATVNTLVVDSSRGGAAGPPGQAGPQGEQGPQGVQGPPGDAASANLYYRHDQMIASAEWNVQHDLGYRPNVSVSDSAGTNVEGAVTHHDTTSLSITFSYPFSGTADCS